MIYYNGEKVNPKSIIGITESEFNAERLTWEFEIITYTHRLIVANIRPQVNEEIRQNFYNQWNEEMDRQTNDSSTVITIREDDSLKRIRYDHIECDADTIYFLLHGYIEYERGFESVEKAKQAFDFLIMSLSVNASIIDFSGVEFLNNLRDRMKQTVQQLTEDDDDEETANESHTNDDDEEETPEPYTEPEQAKTTNHDSEIEPSLPTTTGLARETSNKIKVCPVCNLPFTTDDRRKIYCSKKCRTKHYNYLAYLKKKF